MSFLSPGTETGSSGLPEREPCRSSMSLAFLRFSDTGILVCCFLSSTPHPTPMWFICISSEWSWWMCVQVALNPNCSGKRRLKAACFLHNDFTSKSFFPLQQSCHVQSFPLSFTKALPQFLEIICGLEGPSSVSKKFGFFIRDQTTGPSSLVSCLQPCPTAKVSEKNEVPK